VKTGKAHLEPEEIQEVGKIRKMLVDSGCALKYEHELDIQNCNHTPSILIISETFRRK